MIPRDWTYLSWAVSSGRGGYTHVMSKLNTKHTESSLCHMGLPNPPADRKCVFAIIAEDAREGTFTVSGAPGTGSQSPLQGGESLRESSSPTLVKGSGVPRTAEPRDTWHAFWISYSSTLTLEREGLLEQLVWRPRSVLIRRQP